MTISTFEIGILICSAFCWVRARRGQHKLIGTNLSTPFRLLDAGVWLWCLAPLGSLMVGLTEGTVDLGRYLSVLLLAGAGIAVLGARRPGSESWWWFVVAPMFLVLGWPVFLTWGEGWVPDQLELMTPAFFGCLLVIVMAGGNYLATRWQSACCFAVVATTLSLMRYTSLISQAWRVSEMLRLGSEFCGMCAIWAAMRSLIRVHPQPLGLNRFWIDFRDAYGIVWAYRVMERLNEEANRHDWPIRFEIEGIVSPDQSTLKSLPPQLPSELSQEVVVEIQFALKWIFRRFVSETWCDARLGPEWNILPRDQEI